MLIRERSLAGKALERLGPRFDRRRFDAGVLKRLAQDVLNSARKQFIERPNALVLLGRLSSVPVEVVLRGDGASPVLGACVGASSMDLSRKVCTAT